VDLGAGEASARRAHLLAEAQAMAQLSHPKVITVFVVGTYEGGVFLAMEFVRGQTLRTALEGGGCGWRRALHLYRQAGEALAAAHAAGIVHRDFKPDNVLVGEDGRVRVTDFGLAAHARSSLPAARAGTPAYMSPEQRRGEEVDARSDQYGFCVALHEALHGVRPAPAGGGAPLPPSRRIPAELTRVIARGLDPSRDRRWPTMEALLHALARAARPWTPGSLAAVVGFALLAAGLWGRHLFLQHRVASRLQDAAARVPGLLAKHQELAALRIDSALRAPPVLAAFEGAGDLDSALGLAPKSSDARQLSEAHEVLRSADLPGLESEAVLLLVNAWGTVIYDRASPARFGDPAPQLPILLRALNGEGASGLWAADSLRRLTPPLVDAGERGLLLVSARPVFRGQTLVGAVLAGSRLEPSLRAEWDRALGAHLELGTADAPPAAGPARTVALTALGGGSKPPRATLVATEEALPGVPPRLVDLARWAALLALIASAARIAYRAGPRGWNRRVDEG
jgi:hypothetical protein